MTTCSVPTRSQPRIGRPRISMTCAGVVATSSSAVAGSTDQEPALAARGDGHVAADQEGEAAEHLLFGQAGLASHELTNARGKFLVVAHDCDRTSAEGGS